MLTDSNDLRQLIEKYNRELMEQYATVSNETDRAHDENPIESAISDKTSEEPSTSDTFDWTDIGQLQVRVSTESQAIPIPGAIITVTDQRNENNHLIRTIISDDNGLTPLIDLPTVDRRLTLSPGNPAPYASYTVDVTANGYFPKRFLDLPIYGGVTAIQNVSMIPLPEKGVDDTVITYPESGPLDL